tara:strand:+ start:266 stop:1183 length:918 start_codon:yes stop_codon:yes gene_type:complete
MSNSLKENETLQANADKYSWYHTIKLADGVYTKSAIPHFKDKWDFMLQGMENIDFKNKRVLDVGCRDGLFSFEAEKRGAKEIIGIDNDISKGASEFLIPLFKSKVKMYEMNLYDLKPEKFGLFDVIIFYGVLYHLRYPIWGLKKLASCLSDNGFLLLESGMLVNKTLENKDILYCPVEESPYEESSCTFFNKKGLSTTMRSLKFKLLDSRTINQNKKISPYKKIKLIARRLIEYFKKILGFQISINSDISRQLFIFKKDMQLQLNLKNKQNKHDDVNDYWNGIHNKSKKGFDKFNPSKNSTSNWR